MPLKITVVTPSFNQALFIERTLESVASQTYPHTEHIILDPGSSDGSIEIIQNFIRAKTNSRFILGEDSSQMNAINIGFTKASGDILCWLNSDDRFSSPKVLEEVAEIFEQNPEIDVVYGKGSFVRNDGTTAKDAYINSVPSQLADRFMTSIGILQPSLFMRRTAFEAAGAIREDMRFSFDYEYWVRLLFSGARFQFLDKHLSCAIVHDDAKTMRAREISLKECLAVSKQYYGFTPIEWVTRLVDCQINQSDGILKYTNDSDPKLKALSQAEFLRMNSEVGAAGAMMHNIYRSASQKSWDIFRRNISNGTWFVTAFDSAYFDQGLTLLSGLFKQGFSNEPKIVFDLGLLKKQRELLEALEGVYVVDFARYAYPLEDWYFGSKNYVYKNFAMAHACRMAAAGDTVIWVDAGVYPGSCFSEVVEKTKQDGAFFVDHDDRPNWPFYNATFATDDSLNALEITNGEAASEHLCSCLMGVVVGSKYHALFEDAFEASRNPQIALGNKHPSLSDRKEPSPRATLESCRKQLLSARDEKADIEAIRRIFGYFGHRQDQTIFSIFAARYRAPISSSKHYCPGSDYSSIASKLNYESGGFSRDVRVQNKIGHTQENFVSFHHRGTFLNFDHLELKKTQSPAELLAAGAAELMAYIPRKFHAEIDETGVVAHMLAARQGPKQVMLDVGAHVGTSSQYFNDLGWSIHCFEPDPNNRAKLMDRFGNAPDVRIDPRAVSDKPAKGLQFFTSGESTGISGLHAFRETHTVTATVDATTVADIVKDRNIDRVDFLKIDVEGFDLNVLKGVPWDTLRPDVIECEFEDAKTLRLGHDWKFIANYLEEKGYTVYVSEWHPIVRYGIPHDWRRVVPFQGCELGEDAWGNFLAFREDPGYDAVRSAFSALVKTRVQGNSEASSAANSPASPANISMSGLGKAATSAQSIKTTNDQNGIVNMLQKTPPDALGAHPPQGKMWYSGPAHKLQQISPPAFGALRFARRTFAHVMSRPHMVALLLGSTALTAWIGLDARFDENRDAIFMTTGLGLLGAALVYVAAKAQAHLATLHLQNAAVRAELAHVQARLSQVDQQIAIRDDAATAALTRQVAELKADLALAKASNSQSAAELKANYAELSNKSAALIADASKIKADLAPLAQKLTELEKADQALLAKSREADQALSSRIDALKNERSGIEGQVASVSQKVGAMDARITASEKWSRFENAAWFQHFNRKLSRQHIDTLDKEWRKRLSIPMQPATLGYMANRACEIERQLEGRLATSIEDILLRSLVARAVRGKNVDVLEIGTLFGTGAAIMFDALEGHYEQIHFTLLDPLEGYYNGAQADILTGQRVNESVVRKNFARVGMREDQYTLIKHLSTEPEAKEKASARKYDVLVIDGDHSYAGVKTDFENFAPLVRVGGYIILDDYNSPDWPDVKEYVDKELGKHDFVAPVGATWRTSVYRVVKDAPRLDHSASASARTKLSSNPDTEDTQSADD